MISKTYRAGSLSAAVAEIRNDMGPSAAIVSARTIAARRTLFQTFPPQIELEARVDERHLTHEQLAKLGLIAKTEDAPADPQISISPAARRLAELERENAALREELSQVGGTIDEVRLVQLATQNLRAQQPRSEPEAVSPQAAMTQLLLDNGFDDAVMSAWRRSLNQPELVSANVDIMERTFDFLSEAIQFGDLGQSTARFIAFVGPQGGGKTTTLLKAAHFWLERGESVAILTLPGCDPRGLDILAQHAQAWHVPLRVAVHAREVVPAAESCATFDRILIDTPGVEAGDAIAVKRLAKWLDPWAADAVAIFDARDGLAIPHLETLRDLRVAGTVFTGLDRPFPIGVPYNIGLASGRPCLAFGTGPDLIRDFEPASPERLLGLLFNIEPEAVDENAIEFSLEPEQKGVRL